MEGGGKVKKSRARTKPYIKNQNITPPANNTITPGNSGEVTIEASTGNAGEATTSGENATEEEEENPLMKIIRYVHYKLFERSAVYCDGCKHQFADITTGIISEQSWKCTKNV